MTVYAVTIFSSAFLLFQVQPLLGRYILPWYGGTSSVWTTCLLFFQSILLVGYLYAHLLSSRLSPRRQAIVHGLLLVAALSRLPIGPDPAVWKPQPEESPTQQILLLLLGTVGLQGLLLSSTGPLLQRWFARSFPGRSPYRLYALSNVGSLLALVSYPVIVEPALGLNHQAWLWSGLYVLFAASCGWCAWRLHQLPSVVEEGAVAPNEGAPGAEAPRPRVTQVLFWLMFSALGSALLMATTNQLCQDVTPVPFLWVLPLTLYLLSFILCFDSDRWYHRGWWAAAMTLAIPAVVYLIVYSMDTILWKVVAGYSTLLFALCMICHGELARSRPAPRHLTLFYLTLSTGGVIGGLFVSLFAPAFFDGYWEYGITLAGTVLAGCVTWYRAGLWRAWGRHARWLWLAPALLWLALVNTLVQVGDGTMGPSFVVRRNFYGVLRVMRELDAAFPENGIFRKLMHGRIEHGNQFEDPAKQSVATSYYGSKSGMGLALELHPKRTQGDGHLRVGIIGLGAGTSAVYGRKGDVFRYYEINPHVIELALQEFHYLRDGQAEVWVVKGDARLMMEQELKDGGSQQYDLLVIDAFSSDAVPVHLLTRECAEIYRRHLKPDGMLAIHVSTQYLHLYPIARGYAEMFGMQALYIESPPDPAQRVHAARWTVLTRDEGFINQPQVKETVRPWGPQDLPPMVWTDDYSSLWKLVVF